MLCGSSLPYRGVTSYDEERNHLLKVFLMDIVVDIRNLWYDKLLFNLLWQKITLWIGQSCQACLEWHGAVE